MNYVHKQHTHRGEHIEMNESKFRRHNQEDEETLINFVLRKDMAAYQAAKYFRYVLLALTEIPKCIS